jgi:hypothetical protein
MSIHATFPSTTHQPVFIDAAPWNRASWFAHIFCTARSWGTAYLATVRQPKTEADRLFYSEI